MSIASEIQDLNTNLTAAKNAVTAKGGTVGDTGLAGLATEIASIPSGGGSDYGTVTYVDGNNTAHIVQFNSLADVQALSSKKADNFDYPITIGSTTFNCSQITKVNLGTSVTWLPDYFINYPVTIDEFIAPEVTYIGSSFLAATGASLQQMNPTVKKLELPKVQTIGPNALIYMRVNCDIYLPELLVAQKSFLSDCTLIGTINISFPKLEYAGTYFMQYANGENGTVTLNLPSTLTYMGDYFLQRAHTFASPSKIVCECQASIVFSSLGSGSSLNNILSTNKNTDTMYTLGIDLDGTYSTEWKTLIPDRTSSPYRKLNDLNG